MFWFFFFSCVLIEPREANKGIITFCLTSLLFLSSILMSITNQWQKAQTQVAVTVLGPAHCFASELDSMIQELAVVPAVTLKKYRCAFLLPQKFERFPLPFENWSWVRTFVHGGRNCLLKLILPKWQFYDYQISLNQPPKGLYLLQNVICKLYIFKVLISCVP